MDINDLSIEQLKILYCSALGFSDQLKEIEQCSGDFMEMFNTIKPHWEGDRWSIYGKLAQIEITRDLQFKCGLTYNKFGIGVNCFDLKGTFDCLKLFGILN